MRFEASLRRGYLQIGRHRWVLNHFDMDYWRNETCPGCGKGFTEEPRLSFMSRHVHWDCLDDVTEEFYRGLEDEPEDY